MREAETARPAILGGPPLRTADWPHWPVCNEVEDKLLLEALRSRKWNRYGGKQVKAFETAYAKRDNKALQDALTRMWREWARWPGDEPSRIAFARRAAHCAAIEAVRSAAFSPNGKLLSIRYAGGALVVVYNRLTDFALEAPGNAGLRQAWLDSAPGDAVRAGRPRCRVQIGGRRSARRLLRCRHRRHGWPLLSPRILWSGAGRPRQRHVVVLQAFDQDADLQRVVELARDGECLFQLDQPRDRLADHPRDAKLARALDPFNLAWLEDMIPWDYVDDLRRLREACRRSGLRRFFGVIDMMIASLRFMILSSMPLSSRIPKPPIARARTRAASTGRRPWPAPSPTG